MRSLIAFCMLITICVNSASQKVIDVEKDDIRNNALSYLSTVSGTPFINAKFAKLVSGTPFFDDKVNRGIIISKDRTEYRNILIRLNLLDLEVNYLNNKKEELIVGTPIREVILFDTANNKKHHFIFYEYIETTDKPEKDFFEILQRGKAELYKQHKKMMRENRPYNSATFEQSIETSTRYFVLSGGQWKKINKIKDLPSVLADKKSEVQQYISSKSLAGDNQSDIESVISYYNSFFEQKQ